MDAFVYLDSLKNKKSLLQQDIGTLTVLSKDKDPEIRAYVAETLIYAENDERVLSILTELCKDSNVLVRVNACDTIGSFPTKEAEQCLLQVIENSKESHLVREYALMSYADISAKMGFKSKSVLILKKQLLTARSIAVKAACLYGLCLLGDCIFLKDLCALIDSSNYRDRSFVIHALIDLYSTVQNFEHFKILECLKERLRHERTESVRLLLLDSIHQLD